MHGSLGLKDSVYDLDNHFKVCFEPSLKILVAMCLLPNVCGCNTRVFVFGADVGSVGLSMLINLSEDNTMDCTSSHLFNPEVLLISWGAQKTNQH